MAATTAIRCTLPSCSCDCFAPSKNQIRTCDKCKHGWVAHALDKMTTHLTTTAGLLPSLQVEVVQSNLVFDLASLVLYGTQAVPIRLKIVLDRLFSVLEEEEVANILEGLGWNTEDYARGYIVQGPDGKVLVQWTCVLETEEGAIFNQFLRFGETRSIVEVMIQDLQTQRSAPSSSAKNESNIRTFIERMNKTVCKGTISHQVKSSQSAKNRDDGTNNQSHASNLSKSAPSSSVSRIEADGQTIDCQGQRWNEANQRKPNVSQRNSNLSVPSIHLANLERTVLNAGTEPAITSTADIPSTMRNPPSGHIQNSVTQIRKRSSSKGSHRIVLGRRRSKSAFTISANRKRVRCNVCNKWFYDKGTWKIHYSAVHLKVTYTCKVEGCSMVFSSLRSRNRHSANPNPKIHRIMDYSAYDQSPQVSLKGKAAADQDEVSYDKDTTGGQWGETMPPQDGVDDKDMDEQLDKDGNDDMYVATTDEVMQQDMESAHSSVMTSSVNDTLEHDNDNDDKSCDTKALLTPRLSLVEATGSTRTSKRKSKNPVRCLAVADTDGQVACPPEPETLSPMSPKDTQKELHIDQVKENNNTVPNHSNSSVKVHDTELGVIRSPVIKSEFATNSIPESSCDQPISDEEMDTSLPSNSDSCHDKSNDKSSNVNPLHPSVPPELAGFSPSIDQQGLNADNCFFTLDGFPTCIMCQKSFQSRQGVKVHYQNVHLRMMHTCTVEGCTTNFPSRRSRDRHSANMNLHRQIVANASIANKTAHGVKSDHEIHENDLQMTDTEPTCDSGTGTSESEIKNNKIKVEFDDEISVPDESISLPKPNTNHRSPVKSPPKHNKSASNVEGDLLGKTVGGSQSLSYDSPTLVALSHNTPKHSLADLWTGPRKSFGGGGLVCDICMKSYSTKDTLRTHYKNVHIREMHKCTIDGCDLMFSSVRSRNRHSQNPNLHRSYQSPDS